MDKKKGTIALVIISIALGLILSIQIKTVNKNVGEGVLPTYRSQQLATELKKLQNERESYEKNIDELERKIKQYEENEVDKNVYLENVYNDTMKYRMLSGYMDLEGPGIRLEISDSPVDPEFTTGYNLVDELDLILQVISILNAADAEAISINNQRYTSYTEIVRAADHIEINGVSTNSPIVIQAIGNPDTLESALSIKRGIVWQLKNYDYLVDLKREDKLVVPKYRQSKEFIHGKPVGEEWFYG